MKTLNITLKNESLSVRELNWRESIAIAKKSGSSFAGLVNAQGQLVLDGDKIGNLIISQSDVVAELFQNATGKDSEWVDSLSTAEAVELLRAIVELHFDASAVSGLKTLGTKLKETFFIAGPKAK